MPEPKYKEESVDRWWQKTADTDERLSEGVIASICVEGSGLIARNQLKSDCCGWDGLLAIESTKEVMTLYPGQRIDQTAFSGEVCQVHGAAVKPSLALYTFLMHGCVWPWQIRGELRNKSIAKTLLGIPSESLKILSISLWGGGKGTRTPLHADSVHALIFQIAGAKRFFLCERDSIQDGVTKGHLPQAVLEEAATENFIVDGDQDDVFGLNAKAPSRVIGQVAHIHRGDALVLPAGLYHDVACANSEASLSLTVRFEINDERQLLNEDIRSRPPPEQKLQRLLWRLALKKAAREHREATSEIRSVKEKNDDIPAAGTGLMEDPLHNHKKSSFTPSLQV